MPPGSPSFDLVVATIDRVDEVATLLDSFAAQTYSPLRVLIVDQNEDDRLAPILDRSDLTIVRLKAERGLARARNAALSELQGDVVAFPDDDCTYPPLLIQRVAARLVDQGIDGISARVAAADGRSDASWPAAPAMLTKENVWTRVASAGVFLRRSVVQRVGAFDEALGLGSKTPWSSGEETDYVIRALAQGSAIAYEPELVVEHALARDDASGLRDRGRREGSSVGYLLRKHRYPVRTLVRMAVRPVGGMTTALVRRDTAVARFHAETLRGRARGYFGASSRKSSA